MSISWYYWNDKERLEYCDAMEYLHKYWGDFPNKVPQGGPTPEISNTFWHDWRFVMTPENEVVFGNCLIPAVTKEAFDAYVHNIVNCEVWK